MGSQRERGVLEAGGGGPLSAQAHSHKPRKAPVSFPPPLRALSFPRHTHHAEPAEDYHVRRGREWGAIQRAGAAARRRRRSGGSKHWLLFSLAGGSRPPRPRSPLNPASRPAEDGAAYVAMHALGEPCLGESVEPWVRARGQWEVEGGRGRSPHARAPLPPRAHTPPREQREPSHPSPCHAEDRAGRSLPYLGWLCLQLEGRTKERERGKHTQWPRSRSPRL